MIYYKLRSMMNYDELWTMMNCLRIPKSSRFEHRHPSVTAPVWKTEAAPGAVGGGGDAPSAKWHAMARQGWTTPEIEASLKNIWRML